MLLPPPHAPDRRPADAGRARRRGRRFAQPRPDGGIRARRRCEAAPPRQDAQASGGRPDADRRGRRGPRAREDLRGRGLRRGGVRRPLPGLPGGGKGKARASPGPDRENPTRRRSRQPRGRRRALAAPFAAAGRRIEVLLKVDLGTRRVGVLPDAAPAMALRLAETPGISLRGVFAHAGHAYSEETRSAVEAVGRGEGETLAGVARAIRAAGVPVDEVSVGSTPTARAAMSAAGVTECRPGNYVYNDASQVSLGTCSLEDCAMTVLATVVSVPDASRAVIDAGSKTLSSDPLRPRPGGHGIPHRPREPRLAAVRGARRHRDRPGRTFHGRRARPHSAEPRVRRLESARPGSRRARRTRD